MATEKIINDCPSNVQAAVRAQYNQLQAEHQTLITAFNAVLAKLDADAGVTDTNYAATYQQVDSKAEQVDVSV